MNMVYEFTADKCWLVIILLVVLAGVGLLCGLLVRHEKYISGSGVLQTQIEINKGSERNWRSLVLYKISGSVLCLGAGLSLGREGPSVQIGALTGAFIREKFRTEIDFKVLFGCGAGSRTGCGVECSARWYDVCH